MGNTVLVRETRDITGERPVAAVGCCSRAHTRTSEISGIFSLRRLSRPIFMVMVEEGQLPQFPCSSSFTTGPSISATATFPLHTSDPQRTKDQTLSLEGFPPHATDWLTRPTSGTASSRPAHAPHSRA